MLIVVFPVHKFKQQEDSSENRNLFLMLYTYQLYDVTYM